jgi:hypothetical protein
LAIGACGGAYLVRFAGKAGHVLGTHAKFNGGYRCGSRQGVPFGQ